MSATVFVTSPCRFDGDSFASSMVWSHTDPLAAVSVCTIDSTDRETHQVLFVNNEGAVIPQAAVVHDTEATAMDWQPNGRILAVGWADGMISCWLVDGRSRPTSTFSNNSQHSSAITLVKWNPHGKRIITGDKRGMICVWTVDARGSLSATRQYKKKGEITNAIFCVMQPRADLKSVKQSSSPSFFFGTDQGNLVFADDLGHCQDVQQLQSSIDIMLFYEERSRLIIITRSLLLNQYQVAEDGRVSRVMQVKLSVAGDAAERGLKSVVWASPGLLAIATQEKFVRLLDLAADESYNLSLSVVGDILERNDRVMSVAFSRVDRYLAVGTQMGLIVMWKYVGPIRDVSGSRSTVKATVSTDWELLYKTSVSAGVLQLTWHGGRGTVAAVTEDGAAVLTEMIMHSGKAGDLSVIQINTSDVQVLVAGSQDSWVENTGMLIRGISVGPSCFVVWSGKTARVYRVDTQIMRCEALPSFPTSSSAIVIADTSHIVEESLFITEQSGVRIVNFSGTPKGSISFSEAEGVAEHVDINRKYLAVITSKGLIGIHDVHSPKEPKAKGSAGKFYDDNAGGSLSVRSIKVNCDGTRVAILADHVEGALQVRHPDARLHVYDRNKGAVNVFDFSSLKRSPVSIGWDDSDDRMLACEAVRQRIRVGLVNQGSKDTLPKDEEKKQSANEAETGEAEIEVFIFFATTENGVLMQDSFPRKFPFGSMLGITVPRLYFRSALNIDESEEKEGGPGSSSVPRVYSKVMRDFIGMDDVTESTKSGLLDFSYNLTLGKLDEAYRAVKTIGSPALWENMAQMCVKTKRLDVAEVCLGNMGHARGAAAVRESKRAGSSIEASIGVLAIQLGLLDDAARLFREAERYDLLNNLYQAAGLWDKAIKVANVQDRIHLKTTHYHYARHLESVGDIEGAIHHYELSENNRTEVPRMLYSLGKVDELEDYVHKSDDAALLKWWAAYLESNGRYDHARKYYNKSGDYLSLVRICCFKGDFDQAADIIQEAGDRAASYHFARQLENQGSYQDAINFYADSGCYNHSIRLARAYNLDSELMRFALKSTTSLMLDCAAHFENKGEYDKAVQLYHKGGDLPRALDLCFRGGELNPSHSAAMFDMLNAIAADLGVNTSPQTLARCAEFLVKHKQFEKAIELYVMAKRLPQAIDMCLQHKVVINEDMVERLTPPETIDSNERKDILKDLAKALKKQGLFTLASKKYTQAGDRVRAIKCLVRSGDTSAVIQYATISRNVEIYKLAANYLQQMNWRESVDIMKAIITFYTKAKAFEQLAGFYDSCAQVEIDEYRDYEKAIGALKEALKYLAKVDSRTSLDLTNAIEKRIVMIEKFVQARKSAKREPDTMVAICEALLQEPMLEEAVRSGDCFAMLVEHFHSKGKLREAYAYLQDMEDRRIPLHPYIDADIIEEIYKAAGVAGGRGGGAYSTKETVSSTGEDLLDNGGGRSRERTNSGADEDEAVDEEDIDEEIGEDEEEKTPTPVRGGRFGRK